MEKNWKQAKPTQRMRIFDEIQRVVSETDDMYPDLIGVEKFEEDEVQQIIFTDQYTVFNKILIKKKIPYIYMLFDTFIENPAVDKIEGKKIEKIIETLFETAGIIKWRDFIKPFKERLHQYILLI